MVNAANKTAFTITPRNQHHTSYSLEIHIINLPFINTIEIPQISRPKLIGPRAKGPKRTLTVLERW